MKTNVKQVGVGKVDYIYGEVKQRIISTEYPPGEVLNENAIAEEFGVSRTPVREALRRLQQDHWLNVLPKIGMQVHTFDVNQLKDLFNTKEALEALALKLAVDNATPADLADLNRLLDELGHVHENDIDVLIRLDDEIHRRIWAVANNQMLFLYLPDLQDRLTRAWMHTKKQGVKIDKNQLYTTFSSMIDCIEARDRGMADAAVHNHIEYHRNEMRVCLI